MPPFLSRFRKHSPVENPLDSMPDFQNLNYRIAIKPNGSRLTAWSKLLECERRIEMFKWVESLNDPSKAQHRILLNDSASAFLLTFEATIQFVKHQYRKAQTLQKFDKWLCSQPQYDVMVRGLRVLRTFNAHIEPKIPNSNINVILGGSLPNGTSEVEVSRAWKLPLISLDDLVELQTEYLEESQLTDWEQIVSQHNVVYIFTAGLEKLKAILDTAETLI